MSVGRLYYVCCVLNIMRPFHLIVMGCNKYRRTPIEYTDCSTPYESFAWQTSNLIHGYILKSRWPLLIMRSISQRSNWIRTCTCTDWSISWEPFAWETLSLVQYYIFRSRWPLLILQSKCERPRIKQNIGIYCMLNILRTLCSTDINLGTMYLKKYSTCSWFFLILRSKVKLCSWERHFTRLSSLHLSVKWVPSYRQWKIL
jgi:hypothetical protein